MLELTPGKRSESRGLRKKSASLRRGKLIINIRLTVSSKRNRRLVEKLHTYILDPSVPWKDTITVSSAESCPTNQNCTKAPSPPAAIGVNVGFALHFAKMEKKHFKNQLKAKDRVDETRKMD
jgi:hypothetical protein